MGQAGQRDPHLLAVDDVLIAVAAGSGSHGRHVAAGARLGEAEHGDALTARLRRQKALLLILVAPLQQRQAVQSNVHRHGCPQTRISRLQFLAGQPQGDIIETLAAIAFRDADAENAQLGHARQQVRWHGLIAISFLDDRRNFPLGKCSYHLLCTQMFVGQ